MDRYVMYIGIVAGVCTGISMLPQLVKIIREKSAKDISYLMISILLIGLAGWVSYGVIKNDLPVMITNAFSFLINAMMLVFAIKYKKNEK